MEQLELCGDGSLDGRLNLNGAVVICNIQSHLLSALEQRFPTHRVKVRKVTSRSKMSVLVRCRICVDHK